MSATRDIHSEFPLPDFKDGIRILLSAARYPLQSWRWLQFLKAHPLLHETVGTTGPVLARIHRPYLSRPLACPARLALLTGHYKHLLSNGFGPLVRQAARTPLQICTFKGKSGRLYELQLSALDERRQDGEMVLRLISRDVSIYSAAFLIAGDGPKPQLIVGGLTGMVAVDRSIGIKQVTRDLYGCRPKDLMIGLIRDIGACFGCNTIVLIGNRNKIPDGRRHFCRKSSDYDRNWREMHAVMRDDGNFELSCAWPPSPQERTDLTGPSAGYSHANQRTLLFESIRLSVRAEISARHSPRRYNFAATPTPVAAPVTATIDVTNEDETFSGMQRSHM